MRFLTFENFSESDARAFRSASASFDVKPSVPIKAGEIPIRTLADVAGQRDGAQYQLLVDEAAQLSSMRNDQKITIQCCHRCGERPN